MKQSTLIYCEFALYIVLRRRRENWSQVFPTIWMRETVIPPVSRSVSHSLHYSLRETLDIQEDILLSESCKDHQRAAYCSVWHDGALSTGWCTGTGRNIREFTKTGGGDWDQDEPTKHILLCFFFIGILQVTKVSLVALSSSCYHNKLSANVEIYFI